MRRLLATTTLLLACAPLALSQTSITGKGAGDRVPPGAEGGCPMEGGGRGGSFRYPGPADTIPSAPAAGAPRRPGPSLTPPSGGNAPTTPANRHRPPTFTGISMPWDDPSSWRHWWALNCEPYLGLKAIASKADVLTGSDDFFLGHGRARAEQDIRLVDDETFFGEVAPVLMRLLKQERDGGLRAIALIALAEGGSGRAGAGRLVEPILPFLSSGRFAEAESATAALGILGDQSAAPVLIDLLHCQARSLASELELNFGAHIASRQRAFAAYALGLLGARADGYWKLNVVNALASAVMNDLHGSHELRAAAVVALGLVPLPVQEGRGSLGRTVISSRQDQVRWLLGALDDPGFDPRVRAQAPVSLARLLADVPADFPYREQAVERIVFLMGDASGEQIPVRRGCAQALGWLVDADGSELDTEARARLVEAGRRASDQGVRRFAWIALARAAGRPGSEGDPVAGLDEARAALSRELAEGGTPMRPWAAVALGLLERSQLDAGRPTSTDARDALRHALADARTLEEVGACGIGIGLARDAGAGELLRRELTTTRDPETRGDLALALGMIEDRAALEQLRAICADGVDQPELLMHLSMALALIGDKRIGARLEELLDETTSSSPAANLLAALGRVGAAHTVERLVATAADTERPTTSRAAAVGALGRVTELAMVPWTTRLSVGGAYRSGVETLTTVPRGHGVLDLRP